MSIPSQLPVIPIGTKAVSLSSLALRPLQTVTGVVLGMGSDGAMQVQVGRQTLNLNMPNALPPGTTLTLQAQGSGAEQRLVVVQQAPPGTQSVVITPSPAAMPAPPSQAVTTQPGVLQAMAMQPGQAITGRIIGPGPGGTTQIQVGGRMLHVVLPMPMPPGTNVTLQAQGHGPDQRLLLVQQSQAGAQPATSNAVNITLSPEAQHAVAVKTALTQMVQSAVARQDSMGGLTAALSSALAKGSLPEAVVRAGQQLLAAQLSLTGGSLSGGALQKAILNSGLFQEAMLAAGAQSAANGDVKTALLALRQALVAWLGPALPPAQTGKVPPPVRGAIPRSLPSGAPPPDGGEAPEDIGRVLLDRTEAALSRLRLHQHASLPDVQAKQGDWSVDLPVIIGTYQTMMQFQIQRDAGNGESHDGERGWQMRFAIDLPSMGEVGAQVSLRAGMSAVMLWATQPDTATAIQDNLPALTEALTAAGLNPGAVHCRLGEPPSPVAAAASGHFMDQTT